MSWLKVFTGGYSDASGGGASTDQGPEATIATLCSRLKSSQLLADRRDAVRGLKALAKSYRREVANSCLEPLINCLCKDRNDHEMTNLCLDALCSIFNDDDNPNIRPDGHISNELSEDLLGLYAEKCSNDEVFSTILACLEENDFSIRYPSIRLLTSLLQLRTREFQQLVLLNPTAIARFMDLLSDVREVIRNDVLVLLIYLTRGNSSIQKIVVFENVFEKLFSIMSSEGYADGGVVTHDCLDLLLSLLQGNAANQLLFREGSFVQHLVQFFDSLPSSPQSVQKTWTNEKLDNFIVMFQIIRCLVAPGSGQQQIVTVQRIAHQCGLLRKIAELLPEAGVPPPLLIEALGVVGELTRDLAAAQDSVIQMAVPSMRPPRQLAVVLLMSMINDKQPLTLRLSILYCVQCLLYRNKAAQLNIVKGMCPEAADSPSGSQLADSQLAFSTSAGQLIVSGLMALDSYSTWLTAGVLLSALGSGHDNADLRENLLRAQLTLSLGAQPITLLQQITTTLAMQKLRLTTRAGLLQLLCVWLAYCPTVVDALLGDAPSVACLLSQISQPPSDNDESVVRSLSAFAVGLCILFNRQTDARLEYNREKLVMIVRRRIGIETFGDALAVIASNEDYARCLRSPRPLPSITDGTESAPRLPLFTHEFCIIYRQLEPEVLSSLSATHHQQTSSAIPPYLGMADQMAGGRSSPAIGANGGMGSNGHGVDPSIRDRLAGLEANLADRNAECEQLRRELASYKMAIADSANEYRSVLAEKDRAIAQLQGELMAARSFVQHKGYEKNSSDCSMHIAEIQKLKSDLSSLRQEQDDLLLLLSHQDTRIARFREKLTQLGQVDSEDEEDDEDDADNNEGKAGVAANSPGSGNRQLAANQFTVALGESAFGVPSPHTSMQPPVENTSPAYVDYSAVDYQQQQQQLLQQQQQQQYQSQQTAGQAPSDFTGQYNQTQYNSYPYPYHNHPYQQQQPQQQQQQPQQQQQQYSYAQQYFQAPNNSSGTTGLENYFGSVVIPDVPENGDRDGSESAATSDSQNSQIRIQ